ncbi:MAG: helix-turn-helix domain-containing protein [Elusimicrobia bacterium]|nr:helix-turn-helix domain-containing protein [Elusimicrobiota bacterium]
MKGTKDALEILGKRMARNPRLQALVEAERVNFQAASAIRQARIHAGLTQAQLAKGVGTAQSVIARLEAADYKGHTLRMLEHIAEILGQRVEIRFRPCC